MSALRSLISALFVALVTIAYACASLISRLWDSSGDTVLDLARSWSRLVLRLWGIAVDVELEGTLDPSKPYVFMSNHQSAADIWVLYAALPVRVRMLPKKELARVPVLGWALWAGRYIFIDRGNSGAARKSIDLATKRISAGASVLIFPEGTRSRDGELLPLKKGGFHLAMGAKAAIVPVTIIGARALLPKGKLFARAGRVRVVVGTPIETNGLPEGDRPALIDKVAQSIGATYAAHGGASAHFDSKPA